MNDVLTPGLDILSIGFGDIKITFDDKNPMEAERAKRIIKDMIQRGYSLFVHQPDGTLKRVKRFDEKAGEYVVADGTDPARPTKLERVKMTKVKATVVGRSAGG